VNVQPEFNDPSASARVCLCRLISSHDADSLAPRGPLVCPMSSRPCVPGLEIHP
jgi:hypothetical protein